MLGNGLTGNTPWGRICQNIEAGNPGHWLLPIVKGNAVQQIADTTLRNNRYLQDAGVVFNKGHFMGLRNSAGNFLRPDYQIYPPGGKLGVFDITTPGQGAKIDKCVADIWTNIFC